MAATRKKSLRDLQ